MRILVATDAWTPQVNGVVNSLQAVARELPGLGASMEFLTPEGFASFALPTYPDIRLAFAGQGAIARRVASAAPDHIHIATEGPIGFAVRRYCLARKIAFTTSYHTRFPEYLSARAPVPERWTYALLRRFHNAGSGIMVSTQSVRDELAARGFLRLLPWTRGVDRALFHPRADTGLRLPGPVFVYAGRVAVEKSIEDFLKLDLPGSKLVVGDGPARAKLQAAFPAAHFTGMLMGEALAAAYASADVFVFPSRTDTFGIVLLEALASGLPVAAFPVPGPLDVIGTSGAGVLDTDLRRACLGALKIPRAAALAHASTFTWALSASQFLQNSKSMKADGAGAG